MRTGGVSIHNTLPAVLPLRGLPVPGPLVLYSVLFWSIIIGEFRFQRGGQFLNSRIVRVSGLEAGHSQGQLIDAVFPALLDKLDDLCDLPFTKRRIFREWITEMQQFIIQGRDSARCSRGEVGIVPFCERDNRWTLPAIIRLLPYAHPVKADLTGDTG